MAKNTANMNDYPEMQEIRDDLNSLKDNVFALTKHVKKDGRKKASALSDIAKDNLTHVQEYGQDQVKNIEKHVKAKPAQSVAIAFAAGVIASLVLRGR